MIFGYKNSGAFILSLTFEPPLFSLNTCVKFIQHWLNISFLLFDFRRQIFYVRNRISALRQLWLSLWRWNTKLSIRNRFFLFFSHHNCSITEMLHFSLDQAGWLRRTSSIVSTSTGKSLRTNELLSNSSTRSFPLEVIVTVWFKRSSIVKHWT